MNILLFINYRKSRNNLCPFYSYLQKFYFTLSSNYFFTNNVNSVDSIIKIQSVAAAISINFWNILLYIECEHDSLLWHDKPYYRLIPCQKIMLIEAQCQVKYLYKRQQPNYVFYDCIKQTEKISTLINLSGMFFIKRYICFFRVSLFTFLLLFPTNQIRSN